MIKMLPMVDFVREVTVRKFCVAEKSCSVSMMNLDNLGICSFLLIL